MRLGKTFDLVQNRYAHEEKRLIWQGGLVCALG